MTDVTINLRPGLELIVKRRKTNISKRVEILVNKDAVVEPGVIEPPMPIPPDPASDWEARSAGRKLARRLMSPDASDANLAARHPHETVGLWVGNYDDAAHSLPIIDQHGLRFDVVPDKEIPDWYADLNYRYGANSTMYVQWQQRFSKLFVETVFMKNGLMSGEKLAVLSSFMNTSSWGKIVVSLLDGHKFPYLYQYDESSNTRNLVPGIGSPPTDFDWQPKIGQVPTCLYTVTNGTPIGQIPPGCFGILADKWITFDLVVETGDLIPGTNTWHADRKLYATVDGVKRLLIHYGAATQNYVGRNAAPFEAIWLAPYLTNGSSGHPVASCWYREVIVDDKPIPTPGSSEGNVIQDPYFTIDGVQYEIKEVASTPPPSGASPDNTRIPPSTDITDAAGAVWKLGAATHPDYGAEVLKNGVQFANGYGELLVWKGGVIKARNIPGDWYAVSGSGWVATTDPGP